MKIDWLTFSQCHCLKSLSKCIYDLIESDIQYKHRTHSNLNLWTFMSKSVTVLCLQRFISFFFIFIILITISSVILFTIRDSTENRIQNNSVIRCQCSMKSVLKSFSMSELFVCHIFHKEAFKSHFQRFFQTQISNLFFIWKMQNSLMLCIVCLWVISNSFFLNEYNPHFALI